MSLIDAITGKFLKSDPMDVGTILGLYKILRNKWVRFPCTILYSRQATDKELKHFLEDSIKDSFDHINILSTLLKKNGIISPPIGELERDLKDDAPFAVSYSLMNDKKLSCIMREFLDLSLTVEAEALRNSIHPEARKLIYDILNNDNQEHERLISLKEAKGWTEYDLPPYLGPAQ